MILPVVTLLPTTLGKVSSVLLSLTREAEGGHVVTSCLVILRRKLLKEGNPLPSYRSNLLLKQFLEFVSKYEVLPGSLALPGDHCLPPRLCRSDDPLDAAHGAGGGDGQAKPQCECQHQDSALISIKSKFRHILRIILVLPQYLPFRMLRRNVSNKESTRGLYKDLDKESESIVTPN